MTASRRDDSDDNPACPVQALGLIAGRRAFLSPSGRLAVLGHRDFTTAGLLNLFDGDVDWLMKTFPKYARGDDRRIVGWWPEQATAWLMRASTLAGYLSPDAVRPIGVYRHGDAELVEHYGDVVRLGGRYQPAGFVAGDHVYPAYPAEPRPAMRPCGVDAVKNLKRILARWHYAEPKHGPRLVLGWVGCAMLVGALDWRPHIWVSGAKGTGKSTLDRLVADLLGTALFRVSAPTEAGIRHALEGAARPVAIDEIEVAVDGRASQVQDVLILVRIASSATQSAIPRGSAGGVSTLFKIRSCFYLSSIQVPYLLPSNRSRLAVIELRPLQTALAELADFRDELRGVSGLGPALRARMVAAWPRFLAALEPIGLALHAIGHDGRGADQLGALLAAEAVLADDGVPDTKRAAELVRDFEPFKVGDDETEAEHRQCFERLITSRSRVLEASRHLTVAELINRARDLPGAFQVALGAHGMRLKWEGHVDYLIVSNQHDFLREVFRGSRWEGGGWGSILARMTGALRLNRTVNFGGARGKGVWIPAGEVALPGEVDEGEGM